MVGPSARGATVSRKPTRPSDPEWIEYAAALRELRQSLGMTILDLSADTGITPSELSVMERGVTMPRVRTLIAWRRGLGLRGMQRPDC